MKKQKTKQGKPAPHRKPWLGWLGTLVLVALLAVWAYRTWHKPLLTKAVETVLHAGLPFIGLDLEKLHVDGGLGRPLILSDVQLGPPAGTPSANQTRLFIEKFEITPAGLWEILTGKSRWTRRISWSGVHGVLDYRSANFPPPQPLVALTPQQEDRLFPWILKTLPLALEGKIRDLVVLADHQVYRLENLEVDAREGRIGKITLGRAAVELSGWHAKFGPATARSVWKNGVFYAVDLPLGEEVRVTEIEFELLRRGGPGLRCELAAFAGWIRVDAAFPIEQEKQALELSAWARRLNLSSFSAWAHLDTPMHGEITEARLTYRGIPELWEKGEAAAILRAAGFEYEGRGFESLAVGMRLGGERLSLSEFSLLQGRNQIFAEGAIRIPKNGEWIKAEVTGKLRATLPDLASLSALTGADLTQATGSLDIEADATMRAGRPSANIRMRGQSLTWRSFSIGDLGAEIHLSHEEAEVREGWIHGPHLELETSGTLRLQQPHVYAGALRLNISNLAPLGQLLPEPAPIAGALEIEWHGDGTRQSHSGAFQIALKKFRPPTLQHEINGEFTGTYSPESWYFSRSLLSHRDWELTWTLSAGKNGLYADDILLQAGRNKLLNGEIYLPWNPLPLLQGAPWADGLLADRPLYASIRSVELSLQRLAELAGQELPIQARGKISLDASGPLSDPRIEAELLWKDLKTNDSAATQLAKTVKINLTSSEGRAHCTGEAVLPMVKPIVWDIETPFGFRVADGNWNWTEPTGPLSGKIQWPDTPLTSLLPLLPPLKQLAGTAGAEIRLGGTPQAPEINGTLQIRNALVQANRQTPAVENINLTCRFDGQTFRLENTGGTVGAGPFEIRGGGDFTNPARPEINLNVTADNILLFRDRDLRLRTDLDIAIRGTPEQGTLRGRIGLVDGRIFQKLEITPLLQAASSEARPMPLLPNLEDLVPRPWSDWTLDLTVENDTPFLIVGNLASGEIIPEIHVGGTLGHPLPSGTITLKNLQAYLPFSVVTIPEGFIYLDPLNPRIPTLDVRGFSQVLEYQITLLAQGPLDEGNLFVRSDPPLSQEAIILLLTTGLAPGLQSGAGFGEAAIGQGGLLLLKTLARQFETEGVDTDSIINRLQITTQPALTPGMRATMRGEFRLTENLGVMAQRDGFGFLGAGLTYSIRFR